MGILRCCVHARLHARLQALLQNLLPLAHPGACTPDYWDDLDAQVVCRMLGLPTSNARAFQGGERTGVHGHPFGLPPKWEVR